MPDLSKRIAEFQPEPNPIEQKRAELEVALLEAQVANESAKASENEMDIQLKTAKLQKEMAETKAIKSRADLDDLTFLERESGMDQEKLLEQTKAKAEGDILKERAKYLNSMSKGSKDE
jgi:hypothetical protein